MHHHARPAQLAQPDVELANRSDLLWFLIRVMLVIALVYSSNFLPLVLYYLGITSPLITRVIAVIVGMIIGATVDIDIINLQNRIIERSPRERIPLISGFVVENALRRRFRIGNIAEDELVREINRYRGVTYMLLNYDRLVGFIKENEDLSNLVFPGTSIANEDGEDLINCPISLAKLQNPAMVYCGHVFDEEFLKGWIDINRFTCPWCRCNW